MLASCTSINWLLWVCALHLADTESCSALPSSTLPTHCRRELLAGKAAWLDKEKTRCLILWRPIPEWSDYIQAWVQSSGLQDSVFDLAELSVGDEVRGTGVLGACLCPLKETNRIHDVHCRYMLIRQCLCRLGGRASRDTCARPQDPESAWKGTVRPACLLLSECNSHLNGRRTIDTHVNTPLCRLFKNPSGEQGVKFLAGA